MSNAFTNFLGGVVGGVFGDDTSANLKDYQHADRLYVRDTYARAPKFGFLYFVVFNFNDSIVKNTPWKTKGKKEVGMLVKKIDLPKFQIKTETLNQYNRKTIVQTKIDYGNIAVEFHDDNSDISNDLWKNYYQYYYMDSVYSEATAGKQKKEGTPKEYTNNKYGDQSIPYGFNNYQSIPFFESIDIFVMHQKKFTQITLINPIITDWAHDQLSYDDPGKILSNKMTVAYESVAYKQGKVVKGKSPEGFAATYYDTAPSPLSIGGNGTASLFGEGGVIAGAADVFGDLENIAEKSPLELLGTAIKAKNVISNASKLTKGGLAQEGYSILGGVLGNIQATGNQPGGIGQAAVAGLGQSPGVGILGNIGINLFSGKNSSVSGTTKAGPSSLTGGG